MITIDIPGYQQLGLDHLVLDYNGTLAVDGQLVDGAGSLLRRLAGDIDIHVITADTFGKVRQNMADIPCTVSVLPPGKQDQAKWDYINSLGPEQTICMGNGRNDRLMLKAAGLGVAVILEEGAAVETLMAADVVCKSITDALELLVEPLRLTATLRS
ncbi:MAG: HAD hydrolase family protein [Desulfobacterales bacterium]|nr:HAD hydrolase family protein [Desulfobacterales bacterium]